MMNAKYTSVQIRTAKRIREFKPLNERDNTRLEKAIKLLNIDIKRLSDNVPTDSGLYGKVDELLNHDSRSTCYKPRSNKYHDIDIMIDGERRKVENKTNGGRIEKLYRVRDKHDSYIVYTLDFIEPYRTLKDGTLTGGKYRHVDKIMRVSTFLYVLDKCKAIKIAKHSGYDVNDAERAVQCSSKKLYLELKNGGYTDFDRNKCYSSFEII